MRPLARLALAPLFASLAALAACGAEAPEPASPPAPTARPAEPAEPAAAPVASATTAPEPRSPYFPRILHAASTFRYFPLSKTVGVAISGDYLSTPILITPEGARVEPTIYSGLTGAGEPPAFMVVDIRGDWSKGAKLTLNLPGDRGGTDVDYTWSGSAWVKQATNSLSGMPPDVTRMYYAGGLFGVAAWGGKALYYILNPRDDGFATPVFRLAKGGGGRPPQPAPGKGPCPTRLVGYTDFKNLTSGDLAGVGKLCTAAEDYGYMDQPGPGALAVERWAKGSGKSSIEVLPGTEGKGSLSRAAAAYHEAEGGVAYVRATFSSPDGKTSAPYLARFDGKTWTEITPPTQQDVRDLWIHKDGSVWIQAESELYRRRGEAWERIAPEEAKGGIAWITLAPDGSLWALFGEELWHLGSTWERQILPKDGDKGRFIAERVTWFGDEVLILARGSDSGEGAMFSNKRPRIVLDLTEEGAAAPEKKAPAGATAPGRFGKVTPPTPGCKSLFVVLYKLSRVAPPDYDFPLTREALKGHTEYSDVRFAETEDGGTRYLVAFVPSLARGQKLVKLIEAKVQSARPQMLCGEPPKENRAIKIDLRTGALVK